MARQTIASLIAGICAVASVASAAAQSPAEFYKGKNLTIVVGF